MIGRARDLGGRVNESREASVTKTSRTSRMTPPTMNNARKPQQDTKRDELDLLPRKEGMKRADDLLRALLNSPPDPQTRKPKPKRRERA